MKGSVKILLPVLLLTGAVGLAQATPVFFTTNDGAVANGPNRVSYISVYVDDATLAKCYTESHGNCTSKPNLLPGLHKARYVWANCNNPSVCKIYGEVVRYINVPNQLTDFIVRIPTVKTRWLLEYGANVSLNDVWLGVALGGGTLVKNVMAGCYTASYKLGYSQPIPPWPPLTQIPDPSLYGFEGVCFGASDTYPAPLPSPNDWQVVIDPPDFWP